MGKAGHGQAERHKDILFFISVLVVCFLLAEFAMRGYYHYTHLYPGLSEQERCQRSYYEGSKDIRNENPEIPGAALYFTYSPMFGYTVRSNISESPHLNIVLQNGTKAIIVLYALETNDVGIRNIGSVPEKRQQGEIRIAAVGDSFTWGPSVFQRLTYPALLEAQIPHARVLNFGVEGSGIDYQYLRLEEDVMRSDPDIVVWGIYVDDLFRAGHCNSWFTPQVSLTPENTVNITQTTPPSLQGFLEGYRPPLIDSYLFAQVQKAYSRESFTQELQRKIQLLSAMLDQLAKGSKEKNFTLLIALIGSASDQPHDNELVVRDSIVQLLQKKHIPFIDSVNLFSAVREEYPPVSFYTGHFNELGSAVFAQGIRQKLEELKAIPPQPQYHFWYDSKSALLLFIDDQENITKVLVPYDLLQPRNIALKACTKILVPDFRLKQPRETPLCYNVQSAPSGYSGVLQMPENRYDRLVQLTLKKLGMDDKTAVEIG